MTKKGTVAVDGETVTISKREYDDLQRAFLKFNALQAGGVDDWDWYGEAMQEYMKEAVAAGLEEADD